WQSGLFYADDTPKSGLDAVHSAARALLGGTIARCQGLQLMPVPDLTVPPTAPHQKAIPPVTLLCSLDCTYRMRLEKLATHGTVAEIYGRAFVRTPVKLTFRQRRLAPALYRFTVRVLAPVNTGPPGTANSRAFRLG